MAAGVVIAGGDGAARPPAPTARRYHLRDRAHGEDYEVDAATIVRVTGVEICSIDWAICADGQFENSRWRVW